GFCRGEEAALAALPIQYADYAIWQREWMSGEVLEGQLSYWRKQLQGVPAMLDLPTDRSRPAVPSFRGERAKFQIPAALTDALRALSRREGATLYMVLLATWQLLLSRW